jgi:hypothetical protein
MERRGPATRSFKSISPAKRGDSKPASHGISQRHRTVPPVPGCCPGQRKQFRGAGSGSDAGSSKPTEETGGICIKKIGQAERNYPVFHFLITGRFALYTDHRPLCKLSSVHVKTLNRLQLKMTELHPEIKYIEGKNNIVADFLGRYHGMNIHVTDVKYDEGRVNAAVAALSHKDLGASVQMIDASPFRIRVLQNTDSQLKAIKDDPAVPKSTHGNPTVGKSVHCKISATVIDNIIYVRASLRKGHVIRKDLRIAVPSAMRKEIMNEAHNSWIGGHGGRFKTTERLRGEFWWPGMDADIGSHVATCIMCKAATNKNKPNPPPLLPLPEPRSPNRRVNCDLWGPVRSSTKKNSYVMVITDAFTKFATAVALPGKEAMHVAPALLVHFYTFGIPQQLVTDQGREYCNELEKLMWTALKIRHDVTTPYYPAPWRPSIRSSSTTLRRPWWTRRRQRWTGRRTWRYCSSPTTQRCRHQQRLRHSRQRLGMT